MNIVFVCTCNTCRSSVAEAFAVDWVRRKFKLDRKQQEEKGIKILSAAITDAFEKPGSPASANAVLVLQKEYGIDMSSHRSQMLTRDMCERADFVVCVTSGHKTKVLDMFPDVFVRCKGVLQTLSADIPDPWHMPYDTYVQNAAQVEELVREFMDTHIFSD